MVCRSVPSRGVCKRPCRVRKLRSPHPLCRPRLWPHTAQTFKSAFGIFAQHVVVFPSAFCVFVLRTQTTEVALEGVTSTLHNVWPLTIVALVPLPLLTCARLHTCAHMWMRVCVDVLVCGRVPGSSVLAQGDIAQALAALGKATDALEVKCFFCDPTPQAVWSTYFRHAGCSSKGAVQPASCAETDIPLNGRGTTLHSAR